MENSQPSTQPFKTQPFKTQTIKYVFVSGGPSSGIGKGIVASTVAALFDAKDIPVTVVKIDGYLNYDADKMSPYEHGEAYVTADGAVTDLDLGNYERFVGLELCGDNSITMGKIHHGVAAKERAGEYDGKTVQIVPHITNEIKDRIRRVANAPVSIKGKFAQPEVCIIEIGGTVGDMETLPVFHAVKQMIYEERNTPNSMSFIHVSQLSYAGSSDGDREEKTKPTQHNIEVLRSLGISPDILIMRCEKPMLPETREKLATHCLVYNVLDCYNVPNIHYVPQMLHKQNLLPIICKQLTLDQTNPPLPEHYKALIEYFDAMSNNVSGEGNVPTFSLKSQLAIVGKYTGMNDTYLSLIRAIQHGAYANNTLVEITWIDAETINQQCVDTILKFAHGILIPGGFGSRGITGMMYAAKYARTNNIPYFGICLGMQIMVSEFATTVHISDLCYQSAEWCDCEKEHLIQLLPDQDPAHTLGRPMRLGNYSCKLQEGSTAYKCYGGVDSGIKSITERHRHRYEINNNAVGYLEDGLTFSGVHDGRLCEIAENVGKKFSVGCQFHPEFRSRYWEPHPLFKAFIAALVNEVNN
jgi:CTP synthase